MDEHYDVIILGTGLKECILSGLLSVHGKKVLHMDRNDYYGAESASFNLVQTQTNLEGLSVEEGKQWAADNEAKVGKSKEYNIDLCPKLIMASGDLVKMLLHTKVTRYLEFKSVDGSMVYRGGEIYPIPVTPGDALKSPLMEKFQKVRMQTFLSFVVKVDLDNRDSWKDSGLTWSQTFDLDKMTPNDLFKYYKLDAKSVEFLNHAVCLYTNDDHMNVPDCRECLSKMKLYQDSLGRYDSKSPYLYPLWGLGGLPEGFSRLAAVHGGVYMLRRPIDQILYNDDGTVRGVATAEGTATCDQMIADPTYLEGTDKITPTGWIARYICILNGLPSFLKNNEESAQIIFPHPQIAHNSNVYCSFVSKGLECAPQNRFICVLQTRVSSNDVNEAKAAMKEAYSAVNEVIAHEWFTIRPTAMPCNQEAGDNIFIPASPDDTTHFQNATREVAAIFEAMTGEPVKLESEAGLGDDQ